MLPKPNLHQHITNYCSLLSYVETLRIITNQIPLLKLLRLSRVSVYHAGNKPGKVEYTCHFQCLDPDPPKPRQVWMSNPGKPVEELVTRRTS